LEMAAFVLFALGSCADPAVEFAGDAMVATVDAAQLTDAQPLPDALVLDTLSAQRQRLFSAYVGDDNACTRWNELDASEQAVFLTLSHRLFVSTTPDDKSMLEHMASLRLILGGGADGTDCGGIENNRLFLSMDEYLWQLMVATADNVRMVGDGATGRWKPTTDLVGPHDPFTASNETETGLLCALLVELPGSKPPTAQSHFFRPGDEVAVVRGGSSLAADPYLFEIDHDFDCSHNSNPACPGRNWEQEYAQNYGVYAADWIPGECGL
jgi:hypothetical protein